MRDLGEGCDKNCVARLLGSEGIRSQTGYRRRAIARGGKPAVVAPNQLSRQFTPERPNHCWVTDIIYIRTHEGWLYLAVVLDLFSRKVIVWSIGSRIDTELVLNALQMDLWLRQTMETVPGYLDQVCQFAGHDWQGLLRDHNLDSSLSRRCNRHDNAVAESFFQLRNREKIRRQIYPTRQFALADVFNYIKMLYNLKRRHNTSVGVSPIEFKKIPIPTARKCLVETGRFRLQTSTLPRPKSVPEGVDYQGYQPSTKSPSRG